MKPSEKKNESESGYLVFSAGGIEHKIQRVSQKLPNIRDFLTPILPIIAVATKHPIPKVRYNRAREKKPSWS